LLGARPAVPALLGWWSWYCFSLLMALEERNACPILLSLRWLSFDTMRWAVILHVPFRSFKKENLKYKKLKSRGLIATCNQANIWFLNRWIESCDCWHFRWPIWKRRGFQFSSSSQFSTRRRWKVDRLGLFFLFHFLQNNEIRLNSDQW
jgi:hypothetical protein